MQVVVTYVWREKVWVERMGATRGMVQVGWRGRATLCCRLFPKVLIRADFTLLEATRSSLTAHTLKHTEVGCVLTVAFHPLVDEAVQQGAAVVTESGTPVCVNLELVLASWVLFFKKMETQEGGGILNTWLKKHNHTVAKSYLAKIVV